ncbi:MAG TPA: NAD(P)-dependent oxidoreductase [Thermoanaerobaculia bacterium]|nr:NAD(P)-dependent oxidoreductase [Thermoanaerobaculia bacterium]
MPSPLGVGIIGLGTMGAPMARNLAKAGFRLSVATRTAAKAQALAAEIGGAAKAFERFSDVGRASDVLVTCLPDAPEVELVLFGPSGAGEGLGSGAIVIDCSTIAAESARGMAARLSARGVFLLDAPVSGGQKGAIEGTLTFFVGGDAAALERARPVLQAMGKRITHLGPSGSGQLGKATNQILVAGNLIALSEAMAFAARVGLPLPALHEALSSGAANSWALEVLGKKMLDRDFRPAFAVKHQQKDLAIVLRTAREKGVPLPGTALVHQLLSALEAQGRGEDGTQALLTLYEQLEGR